MCWENVYGKCVSLCAGAFVSELFVYTKCRVWSCLARMLPGCSETRPFFTDPCRAYGPHCLRSAIGSSRGSSHHLQRQVTTKILTRIRRTTALARERKQHISGVSPSKQSSRHFHLRPSTADNPDFSAQHVLSIFVSTPRYQLQTTPNSFYRIDNPTCPTIFVPSDSKQRPPPLPLPSPLPNQ